MGKDDRDVNRFEPSTKQAGESSYETQYTEIWKKNFRHEIRGQEETSPNMPFHY